ncbi:MAG: PDZ domain-containing protein [Phycisphaerales bacterium]|nr:PDZ domain-containing protein [Phycisphaerales bacterium]
MNTELPKRTLMRAATGVCLVAGLACAQSDDATHELIIRNSAPSSPGVHELHLDDAHTLLITPSAQPESKTQTRTVMIQRDDDHEYKVDINNDAVQAWVDGKKVPSKRVKVGDKSIKIVDQDGDTLVEFQRGAQVQIGQRAQSDGPIVWQTQRGQSDDNDLSIQIAQPEGEHPPVMIGITMGPVDEGAASDLDLDADEGIAVMGVIDGLPGEKAGLREGDVIISVDGHRGVGQEELRKILNDKSPGDKLGLTISRNGKEKELKVQLQAYDTGKLGGFAPTTQAMPFSLNMGGGEQNGVQELLERLRSQQGRDLDEHTKKDLEELLHNLQSHRGDGMDTLPRMLFYQDNPGGQAPRALVNPPSPPDTQRMDRLEKRLDRLESRIDRLIELLDSRKDSEHDDD